MPNPPVNIVITAAIIIEKIAPKYGITLNSPIINPSNGVINFDNTLTGFVTVFVIATLEGWTDIFTFVSRTFKDKFYINLENIGNTTSSSIPNGLKDCLDRNIIQKGQKVMIAGFGVGLSWSATVLKF